MRWRRVWKTAKWVSTAVAALVVAATVAGKWWVVVWTLESTASGYVNVWIGDGLVMAQHYGPSDSLASQLHVLAARGWVWGWGMSDSRWRMGFAWSDLGQGWWNGGVTMLYPCLFATALAGSLWWFDSRYTRRATKSVCYACGYDRRGLAADAKCPECGAVPAPAPK